MLQSVMSQGEEPLHSISGSRVLRAGTRKEYAGLDESRVHAQESEPCMPKKRGRPSGPSAYKDGPKKKQGRPSKAIASARHKPIESPCSDELLAKWRQHLASLSDDRKLTMRQVMVNETVAACPGDNRTSWTNNMHAGTKESMHLTEVFGLYFAQGQESKDSLTQGVQQNESSDVEEMDATDMMEDPGGHDDTSISKALKASKALDAAEQADEATEDEAGHLKDSKSRSVLDANHEEEGHSLDQKDHDRLVELQKVACAMSAKPFQPKSLLPDIFPCGQHLHSVPQPSVPQPPGSNDALLTPPEAIGDLLQVHYFVTSFADALQLLTADGSAEPGIGLFALDEAMADGDTSLVHRLHVSVLGFIARSSLQRMAEGVDDGSSLNPVEFVQLNPTFAKQLLEGLRLHGSWPEFARLAARELGLEDADILRALRFSEYRDIAFGVRLRLLSFLCNAAACTLAARHIIDARMASIDVQGWDYEAAVSAGLVQNYPLHQLPRVEALGRDREGRLFWVGAPWLVLRQRLVDIDKQKHAAIHVPGRSSFEVLDGEGSLQQLGAALDIQGFRECALASALGSFRAQYISAPLRRAAAAVSRRTSSANVAWLNQPKETAHSSALCYGCHRRLRIGPNEFAEHILHGCSLVGAINDRASPLQRTASQMLLLELQLPTPFMREEWPRAREQWRTAVVAMPSAIGAKASDMISLLLQLQDSVHPALFKPGWTANADDLETTGYRVLGSSIVPVPNVVIRLKLVPLPANLLRVRGRICAQLQVRSVESSQAPKTHNSDATRLQCRNGSQDPKAGICGTIDSGDHKDAAAVTAGRQVAGMQKSAHMLPHDPCSKQVVHDSTPALARASGRSLRSQSRAQRDHDIEKAHIKGGDRHHDVNDDDDDDFAGGEQACEVCGGDEDELNTMLCDGCDKCFHIYCLPRPLIEVPVDDWFCPSCSDERAESKGFAFRVGCEMRCRDKEGNWWMCFMEAMGPEGMLVHFPVNAMADDEWISENSDRLEYVGLSTKAPFCEIDEEVEDSVCAVCGSAEDSEHLLLCDSDGCNGAYHTSCLRVPLEGVPEGEWYCELCEEQSAVGGGLDEAKATIPGGHARWVRRLRNARNCAQLGIALGALESALRLDELSLACARARKGARLQAADDGETLVTAQRIAGNGTREFNVSMLQGPPPPCQVVIPKGVQSGQKICVATPTCNAVVVIVPGGVGPGQKIHVAVPKHLWPRHSFWIALNAKAPVDLLCKVLEHELRNDQEVRREQEIQGQIRHAMHALIGTLEREERHRQQQESGRQQRQQDHIASQQRDHDRSSTRANASGNPRARSIPAQGQPAHATAIPAQMPAVMAQPMPITTTSAPRPGSKWYSSGAQHPAAWPSAQSDPVGMCGQMGREMHSSVQAIRQIACHGLQDHLQGAIALQGQMNSSTTYQAGTWRQQMHRQHPRHPRHPQHLHQLQQPRQLHQLHQPQCVGQSQQSKHPQHVDHSQNQFTHQQQQQPPPQQQQQPPPQQQQSSSHQMLMTQYPYHNHQPLLLQDQRRQRHISSPSMQQDSFCTRDLSKGHHTGCWAFPAMCEEGHFLHDQRHDAALPRKNAMTPEGQDIARQECTSVLDAIVLKLERSAAAEQRKHEKERERKQLVRLRETHRKEREIEMQISACVDKMIKRLEREEAATHRGDEDGLPYIDTFSKLNRRNVFKVRGAPCSEWLKVSHRLSTARNAEAECIVRTARSEIKQVQTQLQIQSRVRTLQWVSPAKKRRGWNVICLELGS